MRVPTSASEEVRSTYRIPDQTGSSPVRATKSKKVSSMASTVVRDDRIDVQILLAQRVKSSIVHFT